MGKQVQRRVQSRSGRLDDQRAELHNLLMHYEGPNAFLQSLQRQVRFKGALLTDKQVSAGLRTFDRLRADPELANRRDARPRPAADATEAYTDGSCRGNPGHGGWAWAVVNGDYASGASPSTTNQRMELTAVLELARALPGPLFIWSDSKYVVSCFHDNWWKGWLANNWRNSQGKAVSNRELWEPLLEMHEAEPGRLSFAWVRGHDGNPMNELVDRLACRAADLGRGETGTMARRHA